LCPVKGPALQRTRALAGMPVPSDRLRLKGSPGGDAALHLNSKPINCYQFSTGDIKKDNPGNQAKEPVNEQNLIIIKV